MDRGLYLGIPTCRLTSKTRTQIRAGRAQWFNSVAYVGVSCPTYGTAPFAPQFTATISDDTNAMALAKWTNGPLDPYGGYKRIKYAPASDPQNSFTYITGDSRP